jgi:transposase
MKIVDSLSMSKSFLSRRGAENPLSFSGRSSASSDGLASCDLHARQQTIALVDTETGEFIEKILSHEGDAVRAFYAALEGPVVVSIEATGAMQWFLEWLDELGFECRVGHPAKIRAQETRKQKHDRRDARLLLQLLREDRFPEIWMPSTEPRDLRTLLRDRTSCADTRSRSCCLPRITKTSAS